MGRLATHLAAAIVDADNLPPSEKLPKISTIDALLPRDVADMGLPQKEKERTIVPIHADNGRKKSDKYYEVIKNSKGNKLIVAHKSRHPSALASGSVKGGAEEMKKNGRSKDGGKKDSGEKEGAGNGGGDEKPEDAAFTAEEDAQLKDLKAQNKSWKDIVAEMGRPKHILQARFKEIKDTPAEAAKDEGSKKADGGAKQEKKKADGGNGKNDGGRKNKKGGDGEGKKKPYELTEEQKKKQAERAAKKQQQQQTSAAYELTDEQKKKQAERAEKKKQAERGITKKQQQQTSASAIAEYRSVHSVTKAATRAASVVPSTRSKHNEARFTMKQWMTLDEDAIFSFGELQLLSELIMRDNNQTWLRVAGRFYDKTGRRVHPEDIREKFVEIAKMC